MSGVPYAREDQLYFFNLTACFGSAGRKLFFYDISGHEMAGRCRVETDFHFSPEPVVVSAGFLSLSGRVPRMTT